MPATLDMTTVEALARLARQRDPQAWEELLRLHGAAIHRVCLRILGDEALAEDACQETLLQLRDRAGLFKAGAANPEAAARSWIMRVACNAALQMLRQRKAGRRREDKAAREDTRAEPDVHAHAEQAERLDAVRRELAAMSEHDRMPLVLHYHAGLGFEDVAQALNCPVNTAKSRVHRGIERLRNRLALLGMVLGFKGIEDLLARGDASGLGAPIGAGAGAPGSEQWQAWQQLLTCSRTPALPYYQPEGAWSTMAKLGMGAAALLAAFALFLATGPLSGADRAQGTRQQGESTVAQGTSSSDAGNTAQKRAGEAVRAPKGNDAPATVDEKKAVAAGINAFAADFYAKVKGDPKKNLFISPYSLSTALTMTYAGARANTATEMAKVLHFSLDSERLHSACGGLIADLNAATKDGKPRGFKLAVANRLFGAKKYTFLPEFLALNEKDYGAPLERMDFMGATEASRVAINKWVEGKTQEKIMDLIKPGQLEPGTSLVLVNAIYFKGDWLFPFDKKRTKDEPFMLAPGNQVTAATMHRTGDYKYYEEEGKFQALEMPYINHELSMLLFLPTQPDGLSGFEDTFTSANLKKWTEAMTKQEVVVSLPKFKMTWGTENVSTQLKALGMKDAFVYPQADFSGMDGSKMLYISLVLHKAFVDVNEEGTEAAAATAVVVAPGSMAPPARPKPKEFKADHPFVFAIRDNASGAILFLGRVADPTVKE